MVVQFPTLEQSSIEPPNPDYLKVHAAFAKVLNLCGAVMYGFRVEDEAEMDGTLQPNGEMDFASKFLSKLAISVVSMNASISNCGSKFK